MGKQVTTGASTVSTQVTKKTFKQGRVQQETTYTDDTRTVKVTDVVYTYSGSKVTAAVTTTYDTDGVTVLKVDTSNYFSDTDVSGNDLVIEKRS